MLIALAVLAGARARDLVGAGSEPQPRHLGAGAQPAGRAGRHRRRPDDAASRHRRACARAADRGLGLAAGRRTGRSIASACGSRCGSPASLLAAAFASCLPTTARWPLPTGLGGVIGDAMLRLPASLLGGPLVGDEPDRDRRRSPASLRPGRSPSPAASARSEASADDRARRASRRGLFEGRAFDLARTALSRLAQPQGAPRAACSTRACARLAWTRVSRRRKRSRAAPRAAARRVVHAP